MKKLIFGTLLLALVIVLSIPTMAGAMGGGGVNVSIGLPPPIEFAGPPEMIVLPETYVYVVPDLDVDIFFYSGWWWRPWQGRWYRSQYYNSGWGYYQSVPPFYAGIPSGWRNDYRNHRWRGHQWNYQRIPHQQVQQNWRSWEQSKHWENQQTWGVQGLRDRTPSQHLETGSQYGEDQQQNSQQQQGNRESGKVEQKHRKAGSQSGEVKSQHLETGSQSGEGQQQNLQQQQGNLEKGKVQQQHQKKVGSQSGEVKSQHSQQQQGNHEKGDVEQQDTK